MAGCSKLWKTQEQNGQEELQDRTENGQEELSFNELKNIDVDGDKKTNRLQNTDKNVYDITPNELQNIENTPANRRPITNQNIEELTSNEQVEMSVNELHIADQNIQDTPSNKHQNIKNIDDRIPSDHNIINIPANKLLNTIQDSPSNEADTTPSSVCPASPDSDSSSSSWTETSETVLVQLEGVVRSNVTEQDLHSFRMLGVHTETPLLQVGKLFFKGSLDSTLGTAVVFQEGTPPDPRLRELQNLTDASTSKRKQKDDASNSERNSDGTPSCNNSDSKHPKIDHDVEKCNSSLQMVSSSLDQSDANTVEEATSAGICTSEKLNNTSSSTTNVLPETVLGKSYNNSAIFDSSKDSKSEFYDPIFSRVPKKTLSYSCKTQKIFKMNRVFVKKRHGKLD